MKIRKRKRTLFEKAKERIDSKTVSLAGWRKKQEKKKKRAALSKVRLRTSVILPAFLFLLTLKVIKAFIDLKMEKLLSRPAKPGKTGSEKTGWEKDGTGFFSHPAHLVRFARSKHSDPSIPSDSASDSISDPSFAPVPIKVVPVKKEWRTPAPAGAKADDKPLTTHEPT